MRKIVPKALLIHGKDSNSHEKWYPWLKNTLNEIGIFCQVPNMPNSHTPILHEWLQVIDTCTPDENTTLIGHSRGGVAILRWLENCHNDCMIKKVILIATNSGFLENMRTDEQSNEFYTKIGFNFDAIKAHCREFIILHSKDDPWVDISAGKENAAGLGARLLEFENRGHFGKNLEKQEIPELINLILE